MTEATVNTKAQSGSNASVSPIICLAIAESNKELGNKIPEADNVVFPELQSHILQHTIKNKYQDEESQISKLIKANNFTHTHKHILVMVKSMSSHLQTLWVLKVVTRIKTQIS